MQVTAAYWATFSMPVKVFDVKGSPNMELMLFKALLIYLFFGGFAVMVD